MASAAPLPPDILEAKLEFLAYGRTASVGFHWQVPDYELGDAEWLELVCEYLISDVQTSLLALMHRDAVGSVVTAVLDRLRWFRPAAFIGGADHDPAPATLTVGWHWLTGEGRSSSAALTHLPYVQRRYFNDDGSMTAVGYSALHDAGVDLLSLLSALPATFDLPPVPVVLHRRSSAGPLVIARPVSIVGVRPSLTPSTMRRRGPASGTIPPP